MDRPVDDVAKRFRLYNERIATTLYDRLSFIIMHQDWEPMAPQFWLKQALVRRGGRGRGVLRGLHARAALRGHTCRV